MGDVKIREGYQIITNGLLKDIPDKEFTFLENYILGIDPAIIDREITILTGAESRTRNEEIWHQLRNMSEEQIIQHLDTISQQNE